MFGAQIVDTRVMNSLRARILFMHLMVLACVSDASALAPFEGIGLQFNNLRSYQAAKESLQPDLGNEIVKDSIAQALASQQPASSALRPPDNALGLAICMSVQSGTADISPDQKTGVQMKVNAEKLKANCSTLFAGDFAMQAWDQVAESKGLTPAEQIKAKQMIQNGKLVDQDSMAAGRYLSSLYSSHGGDAGGSSGHFDAASGAAPQNPLSRLFDDYVTPAVRGESGSPAARAREELFVDESKIGGGEFQGGQAANYASNGSSQNTKAAQSSGGLSPGEAYAGGGAVPVFRGPSSVGGGQSSGSSEYDANRTWDSLYKKSDDSARHLALGGTADGSSSRLPIGSGPSFGGGSSTTGASNAPVANDPKDTMTGGGATTPQTPPAAAPQQRSQTVEELFRNNSLDAPASSNAAASRAIASEGTSSSNSGALSAPASSANTGRSSATAGKSQVDQGITNTQMLNQFADLAQDSGRVAHNLGDNYVAPPVIMPVSPAPAPAASAAAAPITNGLSIPVSLSTGGNEAVATKVSANVGVSGSNPVHAGLQNLAGFDRNSADRSKVYGCVVQASRASEIQAQIAATGCSSIITSYRATSDRQGGKSCSIQNYDVGSTVEAKEQLRCAAVDLAVSNYACDTSGKRFDEHLMDAQARMVVASQIVLKGPNDVIPDSRYSSKVSDIYKMACTQDWVKNPEYLDAACELKNINQMSWHMVGELVMSLDAVVVARENLKGANNSDAAKEMASKALGDSLRWVNYRKPSPSATPVYRDSGCRPHLIASAMELWTESYLCKVMSDEKSCVDSQTKSNEKVIAMSTIRARKTSHLKPEVYNHILKSMAKCANCLNELGDNLKSNYAVELNATGHN